MSSKFMAPKISFLLLWGLILLLLLAPLMRGLFYDPDYLKVQIYISILVGLAGLLLWAEKRRAYRISILDILILIFLLNYWFSIIYALDYKEALWGAFRATSYIFTFYLAFNLSKTEKNRLYLIKAIFFSTVLLSATALLQAIEVLPVELFNEYGDKRIISFLQHPNTFGICAGIGLLLGLSQLTTGGSFLFKLIYGWGCYLNLLGLMGSQSRGSWLIVLVMLLFQTLLVEKEKRGKFLLNLGVTLALVLITSKGFLDGFYSRDFAGALKWLLGGLGLSLAASCLLSGRIKLFPNFHGIEKYRLAVLISLGMILILSTVTYFTYMAAYWPSPSSQILSSEVIERAERISGQDPSYQGRLDMYRWALAIIADHPLIGSGEGGWESEYLRYQDKLYWSSEVHSHTLQLWVELGTIGFLAYLGIWIIIFRQGMIDLIFYERSAINVSILLALIALFLHSLMDFDLSIPAVSLMLWTMGGLVGSRSAEARNQRIAVPSYLAPAAALLLVVFLAVPAYGEFKAQNIYKEATEAVRMSYHPMATTKLQRALELSPHSGDIAADLALEWAYRWQDRQNPKYREEAVTAANLSMELEPYSVRNAAIIARIYRLLGDQEEWLKAQEHLVSLMPLMPQLRQELAAGYYDKALQLNKAGDISVARAMLERCRQELEKIQASYVAAGKPWNMRPAAEASLLLGKVCLLLGEEQKAIEQLEPAVRHKALQEEAVPWLALAYKDIYADKYKEYYEKQVGKNPRYLARYEEAEKLLAELGG